MTKSTMMETRSEQSLSWWVIVIVAILLIRLPLVISSPVVTPDGQTYQTVADNIRLNSCVSVSVPEGAECAPHWGGNQSPFYPTVIAVVNAIFGQSVRAVMVLQAIVYAVAAAYLVVSVARSAGGRRSAIAVGIVLVLSPVQLGWPRFLLTESFALAGTLWVFAECLRSYDSGRLRVLPIAAALLLALLARWDSILLAIPVAVVGFAVERPLRAVGKGIIIALIISAPIAAWTARNLAHGLSPVPNTFMKSGEPTPWGMLMWADTWVTNLYGAQFSYGFANRDFERARRLMDVSVFREPEERAKVQALFDELVQYQDQPFPAHIDEEFRQLARDRRDTYPVETWIVVPLRRAVFLWGNPLHSFAWPVELDQVLTAEDRALWSSGGVANRLVVVSRHPVAAVVKAGVAAYRYLLTLLGFALIVWVALQKWQPAYFPLLLGGIYAFARTIILSFQSSLDSRYTIEGYAFLEVGVAIALATLWRLRSERSAVKP